MNWTSILAFLAGLYIGSNIPKAWEQWKLGTANLRNHIAKQQEKKR